MAHVKKALAVVSVLVLCLGVVVAGQGPRRLIRSADGLTIYDTVGQVNWLSDANLAGTPNHGIPNAPAVDPGGAMDFNTAVLWIAAINAANHLGHSDWSMPTVPHTDDTCSNTGDVELGTGQSFGYGCRRSALGDLYNVALGLQYPRTAAPVPNVATGPFRNFRPNLYWSGTSSGNNANSWHTFSFNEGGVGSHANANYMYAMVMMNGRICTGTYCPSWIPSGVGSLEVTADGLGLVVYDPIAKDPDFDPPLQGITWIANANLASVRTFGIQCSLEIPPGSGVRIPCIMADGHMAHSTAQLWIDAMNATNGGNGYLGSTSWKLPPVDDDPELVCGDGTGIPGFECRSDTNPMGYLYYEQLGLAVGTPVVSAANAFGFNLQPYLYWGCTASGSILGDPPGTPVSRTCNVDYGDPPDHNFGWSFSFGNGFQGTEPIGNHLYVMVYYPISTLDRLNEVLTAALPAGSPQLTWALAAASNIAVETSPLLKAAKTAFFVWRVNSQVGGLLTAAQADEIVALVRAL
jgi:hypothetical protein